jgi:ABC-type nitrate/sulfonate/bicarbonate transport system ATPase subunit
MVQGLVLENIHKSFATEDGVRPVLQGVSLTVGEGELVTLLGRSGSGKTTLLRIVAGYDFPDGGRALWNGAPIAGPSFNRFVVVQTFDQLFPWRRVGANISFALRTVYPNLTKQEAKEQAAYWLEQTGLSGCGDLWPAQLSGGMKQRAALARAFALQPELLLLDEPFGALDSMLRRSMQELLLNLCAVHRCSVLFVTHDIEEALCLSSSPAFLTANGREILRLNSAQINQEEIRRLLSPSIGEEVAP